MKQYQVQLTAVNTQTGTFEGKKTTHKNPIFLPFADKNSHLTTTPFDSILKAMTNKVLLGFVRIFYLRWEVFPTREKEYSGADWLDLLKRIHTTSLKVTNAKEDKFKFKIYHQCVKYIFITPRQSQRLLNKYL